MSTRPSISKLARRIAVPLVAAAATLGLATAPADAATVSANGWTFQTDISCGQDAHTITVRAMGNNITGTSAYTAYKVWLRFNNGEWATVQEWTQMGQRSSFLDYPNIVYNTPGTYQFYVHYAVWVNGAWSVSGDLATHFVYSGGYQQNNGDPSCTV